MQPVMSSTTEGSIQQADSNPLSLSGHLFTRVT